MSNKTDFTLIGAGIMSATLGVLIKQLMPSARIVIYERLDEVGAESSDAWNNAGTGHSAFCELNYTPQREDGSVDISKALRISQAFEESKQLWAYLKSNNHLQSDAPFINDIEVHNIWPMLSAGMQNISLTKYLIEQVFQSPEDRFESLQAYYPEARFEDWELITAGQRVQIIKKDEAEGGVLKFGTEIVTSKDKSLAALLGASPGASTSVTIMLDVLRTCFADKMNSGDWQKKLKAMIPSYGQSLIEDGGLCKEIREQTTRVLKLEDSE